MSKKRNFFPSVRRRQRRLMAMGERQLAGEVWKYPDESWRAGWFRMAIREFDEVLRKHPIHPQTRKMSLVEVLEDDV